MTTPLPLPSLVHLTSRAPLPAPYRSLALILGLPLLLADLGTAQEPRGKERAAEDHAVARPPWLDAVLADMRANDRYAIVFVVPDDPGARAEMGIRLAGLSTAFLDADGGPGGDPLAREARALLAEAELLCLPRRLAHARDHENVVLLAADGSRVHGATIGLWHPPATLAAMRELLRLDDLPAKRARTAATKEVVAALDLLLAPRADGDRAVAQAFLLRRFERAAPAIVARRERETEPEARQHLDSLIAAWMAARQARVQEDAAARATPAEPQPPRALPHGVEWRWQTLPVRDSDPCPACGMMRMPRRSLELARFLLD